MKPSEISLFTGKEQTLLFDTVPSALDHLNEDELIALLGRVRRGRNKYSDLHRRQGAGVVRSTGKRHAAATSNERTLRKAEIFEDAVSRVARYISRAARANADAVKQRRLADARAGKGAGGRSAGSAARPAQKQARPPGSRSATTSTARVSGQRVGATSAATKRHQAKKDTRTSK